MRMLAMLAVSWLMTNWGFSPESRVIAGPFQTYADCNRAGQSLPWQVVGGGWHCQAS